MFDAIHLARENIRRLTPYSSARHEFDGSARVFLDANENAFGSPVGTALNRYPDPNQSVLKQKLGLLKNVSKESIFIGNGSDEAIDLLIRIFCEPGKDSVVICPPTYGMYKVAAEINGVDVREVPLVGGFDLNVAGITEAASKIVFICSPNNPTGNLMRHDEIISVARNFAGIVVVDEAYIDFSGESSIVGSIDEYRNLVALQTFSKAWGLAGARVGLAFADEAIISLLNHVKPPYNVGELSQSAVLEALSNTSAVWYSVERILEQRARLTEELNRLKCVETVFPSDANFVLVKVEGPDEIYEFLLNEAIVVRNRSTVIGCEGCLRITVGTPDENRSLIEALKKYEQQTARL